MISPEQMPLLLATGLAAGFVDSIAGGGGLLTLPVLLNLDIAPLDALGTNKLQATFGSGSAAWHYTAAKTVSPSDCIRGFVLTFFGALVGTHAVQQLDTLLLKRLLPVLLLAVALYVLLRPGLGEQDLHPGMERRWFDLAFGLVLGFYDGFVGPGTGTFWTMAFMLGLGFNLTKATGYTKVMNLASNLSSLLLFLFSGHVYFIAGITMGAGQFIGARIGSRMVIKRGTKFIRPIFIAAVLAITLRLLFAA